MKTSPVYIDRLFCTRILKCYVLIFKWAIISLQIHGYALITSMQIWTLFLEWKVFTEEICRYNFINQKILTAAITFRNKLMYKSCYEWYMNQHLHQNLQKTGVKWRFLWEWISMSTMLNYSFLRGAKGTDVSPSSCYSCKTYTTTTRYLTSSCILQTTVFKKRKLF